MTDKAFYPSVGFYFTVSFDGISDNADNAFQEVSGLSVSNRPLEIEEGGLNNYKHKVPTRTEFENLVLKRGYITPNTSLTKWCEETLNSDFSKPIVLRSINLYLLNKDGQTLSQWRFDNAWPIKWSAGNFNAQESTILVETLEFAYSRFKRTT